MSPSGFEILYEAGPCLVVNKPGGLLTQAPPEIDSLERRLKEYLKEREQKPGRVYLGVPHRLDRPVSGALVVAKHVRAAKRLSEQFQGRLIRKTYWALVQGTLDTPSGTWKDFVRKIPDQPQAEIVDSRHADGRIAILHFRVLNQLDDVSWLEFVLETGRMHQIRIQSASRGHPILGDLQYGATVPFGPLTEDLRSRWIALHARSLHFRHPMTREPVHIISPLPSAWSHPIIRPDLLAETSGPAPFPLGHPG